MSSHRLVSLFLALAASPSLLLAYRVTEIAVEIGDDGTTDPVEVWISALQDPRTTTSCSTGTLEGDWSQPGAVASWAGEDGIGACDGLEFASGLSVAVAKSGTDGGLTVDELTVVTDGGSFTCGSYDLEEYGQTTYTSKTYLYNWCSSL